MSDNHETDVFLLRKIAIKELMATPVKLSQWQFFGSYFAIYVSITSIWLLATVGVMPLQVFLAGMIVLAIPIMPLCFFISILAMRVMFKKAQA